MKFHTDERRSTLSKRLTFGKKPQVVASIANMVFAGFSFIAISENASGVEVSSANLIDKLNYLKTVVHAKIILVPKSTSFRTILTEDMLIKMGCTYQTSDEKQIAEIKEILQKNNAKIVLNDTSKYDLRYGIYLSLADKTTFKLLFGEPYENQENVGGKMSSTSNQEIERFQASLMLPISLLNWASRANILEARGDKEKAECLRDIH